MACCFYRNPCCNQFPTVGTTGPRGATGPTGPTGAVGTTNLATFYNLATGPLAISTPISLTDDVNFDPTNIAHTTGSPNIILQPGSYLISYNANASSTSAGTLSLTLYVGGVAVQNSVSSATVVANGIAPLASSVVVDIATPGTIVTLQSTGTVATSYTPVNIAFEKIVTPV